MDDSSKPLSTADKSIALVIVLFLVGFLLIASRPGSGGAALQERVLENRTRQEVPVKIKIKKDKEESFKDLKNQKWVRDFELEVTNTGDKPIYYIFIDLVTDVKMGGGPLIFSLHYGRAELGDLVTKARPDDVPINPKETYVFKLHPGQIPAWERSVAEGTHPDAKKLEIAIQGISFGDGTGIFGNTPYPSEPKKQDNYPGQRRTWEQKQTQNPEEVQFAADC